MKKIFMTMLAMLLASNLFADGELFNVCFGSEPAIQGKIYSYYANGGILNVMQVLKNGILVKKNDMFEGSIFLQEKIIFIKMNTRGLSDGSQVPVGQYRCTGTVTYEAVLGASRTVPAFAELSCEEKEQIYQEEKKAEKERKEREIREQPERKKMAEAIISGIDLNMGCVRIEKTIAPSFEITVKHFMWNRLVECKANGDWLGFLNVADDIVSNRMEPASRLELFPDTNQVRKLCDALKKYRFKCEVSCDRNLVFMVPNAKWKNFVACCKSGASIDVGDGLHSVFYHEAYGSSRRFPYGVLVPAREQFGLSVLGDELIVVGVVGSVERYSGDDLPRKGEVLSKRVASRELSLAEFKSEILAMDKDAWHKINSELITMPRGAEVERFRNEAECERASAHLQLKARFADEVAELSFCLGDYVIVQKALVEYVHSVKSDELWCRLRELQSAADWDGMVRMLVPAQLDDGERRCWDDDELKWPRAKMSADADLRSEKSKVDLCDPKVWELARRNLYAQKFKFQVFFTRNRTYYQRRGTKWVDHSFCNNDYLDIELKVAEKDLLYIYAQDDFHAYIDPLEKKINEPGFDVTGWLNSHPVKMFDAVTKLSARERTWPNPRDISPLLKHKDDELNAAKADLSRFRRAVASVKWPPEYLVVTNVSVIGGKMVYNEKKKTFKIPQKVRGLALLLDNKDVVELYGKYCGGLDLGGFKEEWKNAGKKQESVYNKYKSAFEGVEKSMLKALESVNPRARSGFGQPMSLEDIANRQSNYSMPIKQEQPRSSVGKTAKPVCDNCRGRKYVQAEVECPKCGGAGTTYTPAKKLIQGYSKPRTSQCSNCSGRGTIRKSVPCPNCNR